MSVTYHAPVKTPDRKYTDDEPLRLFLAGSINQGTAVDWQQRVIDSLSGTDFMIFNPRRPDWDWTWEQSKNNPKFVEQVEWELKHIHDADVVCFYFDPIGQSPITLFELGLILGHGAGQEIVVFCPEGFWRKGNVDVTCSWMNYPQVHQVNTPDELIEKLKTYK